MVGALANSGLIVLGGLIGTVWARKRKVSDDPSFTQINAIFVLFLGFQCLTAMNSPTKFLIIFTCTLLGGLLGKVMKLEPGIQAFSRWLEKSAGRFRRLTGASRGQGDFFRAFVSTSLLFCIGPMAILGSALD